MSQNGTGGVDSLEDVRAVVARLGSQRLEIENAIFAYVVDDVPGPVGVEDAEYVVGLRSTVAAVVEYGLAGIALGDGWSGQIPPEAVEQAKRAARLGVGLETVLGRYVAGHELLVGFVTREVEDLSGGKGVLVHILGVQASLFAHLVASITSEYKREGESDGLSPGRRRAELVRQLLDGVVVDVSALEYELDVWHLGLIAKGASALRALQILALFSGQRLLAVQHGDEVVWAWLGGRRRLVVGDIEGVLVSAEWPGGVSLAVGEPARGVDGWRQTHWQAQEALRVLRRPRGFSRYADVALLALVLQSDQAARSLREIFLAPLGTRGAAGTVARQTLRAYFKAGCKAASAATELGVTPKTVRRRVEEIEQRLGRPLPTCHAELEIALRIEDFGSSR